MIIDEINSIWFAKRLQLRAYVDTLYLITRNKLVVGSISYAYGKKKNYHHSNIINVTANFIQSRERIHALVIPAFKQKANMKPNMKKTP